MGLLHWQHDVLVGRTFEHDVRFARVGLTPRGHADCRVASALSIITCGPVEIPWLARFVAGLTGLFFLTVLVQKLREGETAPLVETG